MAGEKELTILKQSIITYWDAPVAPPAPHEQTQEVGTRLINLRGDVESDISNQLTIKTFNEIFWTRVAKGPHLAIRARGVSFPGPQPLVLWAEITPKSESSLAIIMPSLEVEGEETTRRSVQGNISSLETNSAQRILLSLRQSAPTPEIRNEEKLVQDLTLTEVMLITSLLNYIAAVDR